MKGYIGDISRLTGLSASGIRYYEKQGVVKPVRKGKYRYYTDEDFYAINRAVNYRAMGFSLPESAELANIDSMDQVVGRMENRLNEIDNELEKLVEVQKNVRRRLNQVRMVRDKLGNCTLEMSPHFIWMVGMRMKGRQINRFAVDNYRLSSQLEPEASPSTLIPLDQIDGPEREKEVFCGRIAQWGTEAAGEMLLRGKDTVREIKPTLCIHAVTRIAGVRSPNDEDIAHVKAFAQSHDLEFCADAFSQRAIALREKEEEETVFYNLFWFPVKKKK